MFESLSERVGAVFEKLRGPEREGARKFSFAAQASTFIAKENDDV